MGNGLELAKRELKIKNLEIKNRIAIPPMVCFYWDDNGYVTEKNIEHYKDLAEGGAGLIIVEATAITKRARLHERELGIWEDGQIEGLSQIVDVIHKNGAKAFIQLVHAGGNGIDPRADAPSTQDYREGITGIEMSKDSIDKTVQDFVDAALRAQKAGFDGVELHGCHGYLISCFCSTKRNLRTDEYGRDKTLFAKQVLQAIRKACGQDFVVGIRFGVFEPTLEEGIANSIEIAPYTDFIDASYGTECEGFAPEGFVCSEAVYGASRIKEALPDMPVFGVHNINSTQDVVNALNTGIDMVDIGKASLVDPAFASHVLLEEPYGNCLHCKDYCRWNPWEMADPNKKCPGYVAWERKRNGF